MASPSPAGFARAPASSKSLRPPRAWPGYRPAPARCGSGSSGAAPHRWRGTSGQWDCYSPPGNLVGGWGSEETNLRLKPVEISQIHSVQSMCLVNQKPFFWRWHLKFLWCIDYIADLMGIEPRHTQQNSANHLWVVKNFKHGRWDP